jgi:hypothetical protein
MLPASCFPYSSFFFRLQSLRNYPRQESNLIPDLRRVVCDPPHPEDVDQESGVRRQVAGVRKIYSNVASDS